MLGVRLEPELEQRLERLAKKTGRTKSFYAKEAIRQYVEDREDYLLAEEVLRRNEPTISLMELMRRYGLGDAVQQDSGEAIGQARSKDARSNPAVPARPDKRRSKSAKPGTGTHG